MLPRIIGHLDMDAFFASVEERASPWLRGLPLVVGSDPAGGAGRGVVSTANYLARGYGIHSAMPISQAWRLSEEARRRGKPAVVFITPDFHKYSAVSREVNDILRTFSPTIEEAGIDESYFDLSSVSSYKKAEAVGCEIKKVVKEKTGLTATVGIGPNKPIAKIASDFRKPDGLTVVSEAQAEKFLEPFSIRKIPGVGPKTELLLLGYGIRTVADAKKFSAEKLTALLGKWGAELYERIRGRDESPLETEFLAKSVGEQETFAADTADMHVILERLAALSGNVLEKFRQEGFKQFRTVVVTIRFADFETKSRSKTLSAPTASRGILERQALQLLLPFLDRRENPRRKKVRLIGVRLEKIS